MRESPTGKDVTATTSWTRVEATSTLTVDGEVDFYLAFGSQAVGTCATVDDIEVRRIQ
jgi:hypothetical protein